MVLVATILAVVDFIGSATDTIGDGSFISIGVVLIRVCIDGAAGVGGVTVTEASIVSKSSRSPLRQLSINASFVFSTGGFVLFVPIAVFMHFFGLTYEIFASSSSSSSVLRLSIGDSSRLAIGTYALLNSVNFGVVGAVGLL